MKTLYYKRSHRAVEMTGYEHLLFFQGTPVQFLITKIHNCLLSPTLEDMMCSFDLWGHTHIHVYTRD